MPPCGRSSLGVLKMSLAGSVVILAVLLLRLLLRRAPRKYAYRLWLAAVVRLVWFSMERKENSCCPRMSAGIPGAMPMK